MSTVSKEALSKLSHKFRDLLALEMDNNSSIIKEKIKMNFCYKQLNQEFCFKLIRALNMDETNNISSEYEEQQKKLNLMLSSDADVIPNEYEGGFKIWEGLFDLIQYLQKSNFLSTHCFHSVSRENEEITICDLGCGSGLLSIYIVQHLKSLNPSAKFKIYLQDYNDQVINLFTIPNVLLNELNNSLFSNLDLFYQEVENKIESYYKFLWGDWQQIKEMLVEKQIKFDLIVTSETIYKENNYAKLCDIFYECLRQPNGQILIATKNHYFGVGGGTYSFLEYLDDKRQMDKQRKIEDKKTQKYLGGNVVDEIEGTLLRHIIHLKWFHQN